MLKLAIFISGTGSNMKAIVESIERGDIENVSPALVLSSTEKAKGLHYAKEKGIDTHVFSYKGLSQDEINAGLLDILAKYDIDMIILAGFMKILPAELTRKYKDKILNIHPSLIPKFCGKGFYGMRVHEAVIEAGEKESGATVHFVDEGVDTGKIILQEKCAVYETDSAEDLQKRVLKIEHTIYSKAIDIVANCSSRKTIY